jgi:sugar fermentation stimulation protein A
LNRAYNEGVEILVYKTENTLEKIELVGNSLKFNLEK